MILLVRAEILKLLRRKTYLLMVVILAALVGMTAFFVVLFPRIAPELAEGLQPIPKPDGYVFGAQQIVGQTWFPMILAVMMLGSEVSGTFWATSLTREARRIRHVLSRLGVLSVAAWLAVLAAIAGFAVVVVFGGVGDGRLTVGEWLNIGAGALLVQVAWVAIGLGLVGILRAIGPAIGVALALTFAESLLVIWRPYTRVSLSANSMALLGTADVGGMMGDFYPISDITRGRAAAVVAVWTVAALGLAWWSLARRDA